MFHPIHPVLGIHESSVVLFRRLFPLLYVNEEAYGNHSLPDMTPTAAGYVISC